MGNKINRKLLLLTALFLLTCVFVYNGKGMVPVSKQPLKQYFGDIDNYRTLRHIKLADSALNMLDLDDYLYVDYEGPNANINLYIGYYYTADKASAPHSPLVCYPSQGWEIEDQTSDLTLKAGIYLVNYNEIITSLGGQKELVLYWFQAHHHTNTQTVMNKIEIGYNKLIGKNEQNAFVRVSVPLKAVTLKQAQQNALDFIKVFYPQFIQFIDEG